MAQFNGHADLMKANYPMPEFLTIVGAVIAVLTLIGLVHRMLLKKPMDEARAWFTWAKKFQRDWEGEPAEPGRDAVPGVMERLNRIDGELNHNGGSSLKDKVFQTWSLSQDLDNRVTTMEAKVEDIFTYLKSGKVEG